MEEAFIYLLKSAGVLSIFVVTYHFLLRRLTFFKANRWFLLLALIASIGFPLIEITQTVYVEQPAVQASTVPFSSPIVYVPQETPVPSLIDVNQLLLFLYIAISLFLIGKMTVELLSLYRLIRSGSRRREGGFIRISLSRKVTPFSFFNYICFYEKEESSPANELILKHEQVHAREWHSIDLLLTHLYCAVFWLNPLAWLLKRQIGENLEFTADATAKVENTTGISYERTLLSSAASHMQPALANNFFTPFIKKRIQMLQKETFKTWNAYKYALILPVIVLFLYSFNTVTKTEYVKSAIEKNKTNKEALNSENFMAATPLEDESRMNSFANSTEDKGESAIDKIQFKIPPTTTKESLDRIKKDLKTDHNVDLKISNLKYKEGKITSINIQLDDNRGFKGSQSYTDDTAIPTICITGIVDEERKSWNMGNCDSPNMTVIQSSEDWADLKAMIPNLNLTKLELEMHDEQMDSIQASLKLMQTELLKLKTPEMKAQMRQQLKDMQLEFKKTNMDSMQREMKKSIRVARQEFKKMDMDSIRNQMKVMRDSLRNNVFILREDRQQWRDSMLENQRSNIYAYQGKTPREGYEGFLSSNSTAPLFILDGKVVKESDFRAVNPNSIKSVSVFKDGPAIEKYGEAGKNGVIIVESKTAKDKVVELSVTNFSEGKMKELGEKIKKAGYSFDLKTYRSNVALVTKLKFELDGTTYTYEPKNGIKSLTVLIKKDGTAPKVSAVTY